MKMLPFNNLEGWELQLLSALQLAGLGIIFFLIGALLVAFGEGAEPTGEAYALVVLRIGQTLLDIATFFSLLFGAWSLIISFIYT